jgi:hypothetical protein
MRPRGGNLGKKSKLFLFSRLIFQTCDFHRRSNMFISMYVNERKHHLDLDRNKMKVATTMLYVTVTIMQTDLNVCLGSMYNYI